MAGRTSAISPRAQHGLLERGEWPDPDVERGVQHQCVDVAPLVHDCVNQSATIAVADDVTWHAECPLVVVARVDVAARGRTGVLVPAGHD
jgi:hypothetical protein